MPFDLMFITHEAINFFLLFSFYGFFKNILFDKEKEVFIRDGEFHTLFNHDKDLGCDFSLLKKRYKSRIKNINLAMKSKDHIVFIQNSEDTSNDINTLYEIIRFKRKNRPFSLILIDVSHTNSIDRETVNNNIILVRHPYPTKEYIWWHPDFRNSEIGKSFEDSLCRKIKSILSNLST